MGPPPNFTVTSPETLHLYLAVHHFVSQLCNSRIIYHCYNILYDLDVAAEKKLVIGFIKSHKAFRGKWTFIVFASYFILKFIDISKNILVQNPDKGPLRFTPLDSTQHCTGGPPSLILVRHPMAIILYSRHAPPQSAAATSCGLSSDPLKQLLWQQC